MPIRAHLNNSQFENYMTQKGDMEIMGKLKKDDLKDGCVVKTYDNREWVYKEKVSIHGNYYDWALVSIDSNEYISCVYYDKKTLTSSYIKREYRKDERTPIDIVEIMKDKTVEFSVCPHCGNQYYGPDIIEDYCMFCPFEQAL